MSAIVNGMLNPKVCVPCCRGGVPDTIHLDDGVSHPAVRVPPENGDWCNDGWTAGINWMGHLTATEIWAVNTHEGVDYESDRLPIEVPEPGPIGFVACALVLALLARKRK